MKTKILLLPALAAGSLPAFQAQAQEKPNMVIIFIDDLGYNDLGYHNPSFETPNIDKMAEEGIDFCNAYVPSPTSSPSRAALLTGRYPIKMGISRHFYKGQELMKSNEFVWDEKDPGRIPNRTFLPLCEETFAEALNPLGYRTVALGKWHLGGPDYYPAKAGFKEAITETSGISSSHFPPYFKKPQKINYNGKYLADHLTEQAVKIIEENDYEKEPLCLYLAHFGVHSPHEAPLDLVKKYEDRGINHEYAIYHAMVECIDRSTGEVLDALKRKGVLDNTLVIFASDQGGYFTNTPLRGGKLFGSLYDGSAKVPFLVRYPKGVEGRKVEERIATTDVFPTLVELAGGDPADHPQLDGQSLVPGLMGKKMKEHTIYFYRSYNDQPAALIYKDYKFIWSRSGRHEMYNLDADPNEHENLAHDKKSRRMYRKCLALMTDFLNRYEPAPIPE